MADNEKVRKDHSALFDSAIDVEALKQHDPSVTFTCERLGETRPPGGFWARLLDAFRAFESDRK